MSWRLRIPSIFQRFSEKISEKKDVGTKVSQASKMVVSEDDVMNIMGGMEHAGGIKLNDHKRKLKNRYVTRLVHKYCRM